MHTVRQAGLGWKFELRVSKCRPDCGTAFAPFLTRRRESFNGQINCARNGSQHARRAALRRKAEPKIRNSPDYLLIISNRDRHEKRVLYLLELQILSDSVSLLGAPTAPEQLQSNLER